MKPELDRNQPILVTGAAGQIGSVGFKIVELLRQKKNSVRAMVRKLDDRSQVLANQVAAKTIKESGEIKLPFGSSRTAPIASYDVARVIAKIIADPAASHIGKVYELTGLKSQNLKEIAQEYSLALGRPIKYVDMPMEEWATRELKPIGLPDHVYNHILTMAHLHKENRYDRFVNTVEEMTGVKPMSIKNWVQAHISDF